MTIRLRATYTIHHEVRAQKCVVKAHGPQVPLPNREILWRDRQELVELLRLEQSRPGFRDAESTDPSSNTLTL